MKLSKLLGIEQSPVTEIRNGRCGELRYQSAGKYAGAYYEISGVPEFDLLVWLAEMQSWSDGSPITPEENTTIVSAFKAWASQQRVTCQW